MLLDIVENTHTRILRPTPAFDSCGLITLCTWTEFVDIVSHTHTDMRTCFSSHTHTHSGCSVFTPSVCVCCYEV